MLALETPDSRSIGLSIVSPSPNLASLEAVANTHNVVEQAGLRKAAYGRRKVIVGMDRCSRLSGVTLKLLAYEKLLSECPQLVGKVVLVQRCIVSHAGAGADLDSVRSSKENKYLVQRIALRFGASVIDYAESGHALDKAEQLKLWLMADVLLHTPVSEKYNTAVLEFVWTFRFRRESPPLIIISEFSGVTPSLSGVYEVNPFNVAVVSSTIDKALTAEKEERQRRAGRLLDSRALLSKTSQFWSARILQGLLVVWQGCDVKHNNNGLTGPAPTGTTTGTTIGSASTSTTGTGTTNAAAANVGALGAGSAPAGAGLTPTHAARAKGTAALTATPVSTGSSRGRALTPSSAAAAASASPAVVAVEGSFDDLDASPALPSSTGFGVLSDFAFGLDAATPKSPATPMPSPAMLGDGGDGGGGAAPAEKEMVDLEAYTNTNSIDDANLGNELTPIESHAVTAAASFCKVRALGP
jgi:hypothetical protein